MKAHPCYYNISGDLEVPEEEEPTYSDQEREA
jgi:hypothetical protein